MFRIFGLENKEANESGSSPAREGVTKSGFNFSLSKLQTFVSLAAGIVSITGAMVAIPNFFKSGPDKGKLVLTVQDAKTEKGVPDATVEILTPKGALVTTLTADSLGQASCTVGIGHFRVHVSHPQLGEQTREVQVVSGQSTRLRVQLRPSTSLPRTFKKFFGH